MMEEGWQALNFHSYLTGSLQRTAVAAGDKNTDPNAQSVCSINHAQMSSTSSVLQPLRMSVRARLIIDMKWGYEAGIRSGHMQNTKRD